MPPRPPRGGPRQRLLPTPRGVNMIMWSLDNRFVLAAIMGILPHRKNFSSISYIYLLIALCKFCGGGVSFALFSTVDLLCR